MPARSREEAGGLRAPHLRRSLAWGLGLLGTWIPTPTSHTEVVRGLTEVLCVMDAAQNVNLTKLNPLSYHNDRLKTTRIPNSRGMVKSTTMRLLSGSLRTL